MIWHNFNVYLFYNNEVKSSMKIIGINGSARKNGNTAILINKVFEELHKKNIETELIQLAGNTIRGCTGCRKCFETKDNKCVIKNDNINDIIEKMISADGIILGSPTYFSNITSEMKAFIDRTGYVAMANGFLFKRKIGAAVVAVRRAGSIHAFNSMNHFFLIQQMIVPGSSYWNLGIGRDIGEVEHDAEGMNTMANLGKNMAWLLRKIK
jgi:multimeric flavodoxin WrbA